MLSHRVIVAIFVTLLSQGNITAALPAVESQFNGQHIYGRDASSAIEAREPIEDKLSAQNLGSLLVVRGGPGSTLTTSTSTSTFNIADICSTAIALMQSVQADAAKTAASGKAAADAANSPWALYKANFLPAVSTLVLVIGGVSYVLYLSPTVMRWLKGNVPENVGTAPESVINLAAKCPDVSQTLHEVNADIKKENDRLIAAAAGKGKGKATATTLKKISENPNKKAHGPEGVYTLYDDMTEQTLLGLLAERAAEAVKAYEKKTGHLTDPTTTEKVLKITKAITSIPGGGVDHTLEEDLGHTKKPGEKRRSLKQRLD